MEGRRGARCGSSVGLHPPGRHSLSHQHIAIVEHSSAGRAGSPSEEDLAFIEDEEARSRRYAFPYARPVGLMHIRMQARALVRGLPAVVKPPWGERFPGADPDALDLLDGLLQARARA